MSRAPRRVRAGEKPPQSQPQKPPETEDVVRITTELVQTDVMVFDKDGRFVPGLKQGQFELLVDGKPQEISFLESVVTGGRNEGSAPRAARDTNPRSQPVRKLRAAAPSFFINDLHLSPSSLSRTHKTITNFINKMMGPEDQVASTQGNCCDGGSMVSVSRCCRH